MGTIFHDPGTFWGNDEHLLYHCGHRERWTFIQTTANKKGHSTRQVRKNGLARHHPRIRQVVSLWKTIMKADPGRSSNSTATPRFNAYVWILLLIH
jgi:hypothetical protein